MADRIWVGAANNDWDNTSNWDQVPSGAGGFSVPTHLDDVVLQGGYTNACIPNVDMHVKTLTVTDEYTDGLDHGGNDLTASGYISFDFSQDLSLGIGTITIKTDDDFHVGSTVNSLAAGGDLVLEGTGDLDIDKDPSTDFDNITCAYNGKTTTITGLYTYWTGVFTCNNAGGTLTLTNAIIWTGNGIVEPFVQNGATITGANKYLWYNPTGASTIAINTINFGNGAGIRLGDQTGVATTYNMSGSIALSNYNLQFYSDSGSNGTTVFNTNNNALSVGNQLDIYQETGVNTSTFTANFGSSTVTTSTIDCTKDAGADCNWNLQTSDWTVTGTTFNMSNIDIDAGTSTADFTGTVTITSDSQSLYTVTKTAGGAMTLGDAASFNTLDIDAGGFDMNGQTLTTVGNISIDGAGTVTLDSTITMTGDGDFHIGSTVSSLVAAGGNLDLKGTGALDVDEGHGGSPFNNITCSYNGKTTTHSGAAALVVNGVLTLQDAGGTFVIEKEIQFTKAGVATPFITNSATITCVGTDKLDYRSSGAATITIEGRDYDGARIYTGCTTAGARTYDVVSGTLTCGGIYINPQTDAGSTWTFNTNNNDLNLTSFLGLIGNVGTNNNVIIFNAGSSTINNSGFLQAAAELGSSTFNLATSTWIIGTNIIIDPESVVNAGSSQITFSGGSASTCTLAGQGLYAVISNKSANGLTLVDAFSCNTFEVNDGDFDMGGKTLTSVSGVTIDGDDDIILDAAITVTGDGDFHVGNTVNSLATNSCSLDLQGDGDIDISVDISGTPLNNVTCAASGKTTNLTGTVDLIMSGTLTCNASGTINDNI